MVTDHFHLTMTDNLGEKMVTSVIYFMYTLGKKTSTKTGKMQVIIKKPNPEVLANSDLLLMEIEIGSWAGNMRLVVCTVSEVFGESSGNCVCSNVKNKFLFLCALAVDLQHTCVTMGTLGLLQSHNQSMIFAWLKQLGVTSGLICAPRCATAADNAQQPQQHTGWRKRERGIAQSTAVTATGNGQRAFSFLKKPQTTHGWIVFWKINLDVYVYIETHRYIHIIIICCSCPNFVKGRKFSQTTWWWKLSAMTKCWENCFRLPFGYSKSVQMFEVLIIPQAKRN